MAIGQWKGKVSVVYLNRAPRAGRSNAYLDGIVRREMALRFVDRLKNILMREPRWMALEDDIRENRGRYLGDLRTLHFIKNHPMVFESVRDERGYRWLRFSKTAYDLLDQQAKYKRDHHRDQVVESLTKILMMCKDKRLLASKASALARVLGFPVDYETTIFCKNLKFFKPTVKRGVRYLELSQWRPELAVTAREKWIQEAKIINPYAFPEAGFRWSNEGDDNGEAARTMPQEVRDYFDQFQKIPFPSPYKGCEDLSTKSPSAEKRAVAVCHEILSLSLEKRANSQIFGVLTEELMLPEKTVSFLHKHEPLFYISYVGSRPIVFLREAYDGCCSKHHQKHPLWRFKERFLKLGMGVPDCEEDEEAEEEEMTGSVEYDTEGDSDLEMETSAPRAYLQRDPFDLDGWCA